MSGKKWLVALVVLLLVALGAWLWWRAPSSSLQKETQKLKPQLTVASLDITDITEDELSATANITLRNNLPIEVTTKRLNYVIYIDSAKVIEDSYNQPITIRSSDTTVIKLPMKVMLAKLAAVLKRFDNQKVDSADYSVKATFEADVPIAGERMFTMNLSKRLPAVRLPKIHMEDLDIGKLGLKNTDLDVSVTMENPNAFPLKMKDASYKLTIDNDDNVMQGKMQEVVSVPAHGSAPVAMQVDMKTMKIPKLGWKMLFNKKGTHFTMNFKCKIMSENGLFNNSNMMMNMKGTLDDLADVAKKAK